MDALPFRDRNDAANRLAQVLVKYRVSHPLVIAIPRGAVPMARVLADELDGEVDVALVRKLGAPNHPEYAIGSVDEQGNIELTELAAVSGASERYIRDTAERELELIRHRRVQYSPKLPAISATGRTVIVVDDGLATGATMIAALKGLRAQGPEKLVCAVPVGARDSLARVASFADEVVCLATPEPFYAVSPCYLDFGAVSDEEVMQVLSAPLRRQARPDAAAARW